MVTALDASLPDDIRPAIEEYGKLVHFRTFPSQVVNESDSVVTLGTPVDVPLKVTPPKGVVIKLAEDGTGIEMEAQEILLLTLNGTDDAISFVPTIGHPVLFDSKEPLIVKAKPIYSGELIAAYQVFLEA